MQATKAQAACSCAGASKTAERRTPVQQAYLQAECVIHRLSAKHEHISVPRGHSCDQPSNIQGGTGCLSLPWGVHDGKALQPRAEGL